MATLRGDSATVATFEAERDRLFGLAYRMTSSVMDADDLVQEAWVRFDRAVETGDEIREPAAFLTTITTRLAMDRLGSAQHRRETYVGPWLPEPILTDRDPAHIVELDDSIRLGFLTVLERLNPVDRAVFLLREVFGLSYEEVAATVGRSEDNCRQINRRARERVRAERPPQPMSDERRRELLDAFIVATLSGEPAELESLLAADVVLTSDGGSDVRAARQPVVGPQRLARFMVNLAKRTPEEASIDVVEVNGEIGVVIALDGEPFIVQEVVFRDGLVHRMHSVLNTAKLAAVRAALA